MAKFLSVLLFYGLCCAFLFFSFTPISFAVTLFSEDFESNRIDGWSSSGGGATATTAAEFAKNSSYSIKVQHDKTSSYGFQTVIPNIEGGMFYEALGFGKTNNANTAGFFLRVAWYSSNDGSGSQLSSPSDSNSGNSESSDWISLNTGSIQAPSNAGSAKVRLVLNSKTSGQLASAYFDSISFKESVAPTPIPTDTPTQTPSPTSSPTKIPTPTSKITITLASSIVPTLKEKLDEVLIASETPTIDLFSPTSTPSLTPVLKTEVLGESDNNIFSRVLIGIGGVLVISCGILGFWSYRKNKIGEN